MSKRKMENSKEVSNKRVKYHDKMVGLDEAGRGCIFGRIYVSAVVLGEKFVIPEGIVIRDSKTMSSKQISKAAEYIKENAKEFKIGWRDEKRVDEINITAAAMEAFHECLDSMETRFEMIIMDGNYFVLYSRDGEKVPHQCIPKADDVCLPVSCASILAKNARDTYIKDLCEEYPELEMRYKLTKNVGYPGREIDPHKIGIRKYGLSQFHRLSYKSCNGYDVNPVKKSDYCSVLLD